MHFKRIILIVAMLIIMISFSGICAESEGEDSKSIKLLSEMPPEEQVAFVESMGIKYPPFTNADDWKDDIVRIIKYVEDDPDYFIVYSYYESLRFGEEIKKAVNEYYGRTPKNLGVGTKAPSYTLVDSTIIGSWSDSYINYNCYAYSINYPNSYYTPGCFSGVTYNLSKSIYNQALDVKSDLQSSTFSYSCIKVTSMRPTSLLSGQSAICIRKGSSDFHFMKKVGSYWQHKPDGSNPLRYNYANPGTKNWSNEGMKYGINIAPSTYYTSSIYYILYKSNHNSSLAYEWTGEHYHSGTKHYYQYGYKCSDCGDYVSKTWTSVDCPGPPCQIIVQKTDPEIEPQ